MSVTLSNIIWLYFQVCNSISSCPTEAGRSAMELRSACVRLEFGDRLTREAVGLGCLYLCLNMNAPFHVVMPFCKWGEGTEKRFLISIYAEDQGVSLEECRRKTYLELDVIAI